MTGLKPGLLLLVLSPLLGCADQMVGWGLNERPTVDNTLPAYGATDVGLGTLVIAEFSEEMDPLTINGDTFFVRHGATPVAGDITYEGVTATFTPDQPLLAHTVYSVTVDNDASDLSGLGMQDDVGWSFTTGRIVDIIGPTVLFVTPDDLETGVELDTTLSATFSEVMHPLTITTDTFLLVGPTGIEVPGVVTQFGTTAWFNPDVDLLLDTTYTATITEQAQDISGNALPGDYVWTFQTGLTLPVGTPYVVVTDPDDEDINVAVDTNVSATFSEAMHPLTIDDTSFLLYDGLDPIEGTVTQVGLTAFFDPVDDLQPNTEYTGTITDAAEDLDGNAIAEDYVWTFTTGTPHFGAPPVDLGILSSFVAVAGSAINNSAPTYLNGDVGISPGVACTACTPPSMFITGELHLGDSIAEQAKDDLTDALIQAQAFASDFPAPSNLADKILFPGVYTSATSLLLDGPVPLTLDAQGDPDAFWIFQAGSTLTVNSGSRVVLINGARASNVFWAVGSSSTLLSNVQFQGTILAQESNSVGANSVVVGRLLCTVGAITLLSNTVTLPQP